MFHFASLAQGATWLKACAIRHREEAGGRRGDPGDDALRAMIPGSPRRFAPRDDGGPYVVSSLLTLVRLAPIAAIPVALVILADRKRADYGEMPVGQAGLVRPGVELLLDLQEVALRCRRRRDVEPSVAQTSGHVLRRHEGVVAQE